MTFIEEVKQFIHGRKDSENQILTVNEGKEKRVSALYWRKRRNKDYIASGIAIMNGSI